MEEIKDYLEKNKERFLEELFGLLRIPSVSPVADYKDDMVLAAKYWKKILLEAGADKAEIYSTEGNPVVYGEKIIDPSKPTVMVYAHYDVMPPDPLDRWTTPPFEPVVKEGKIYARGADDDKGQGFMHAKAFEIMINTHTLPCNVKFMIEGEEEIGSPSLASFMKEHKTLLQADIILVSDTSMIGMETPSITTGLRGLAYMEVELTGPNRDLHSGLYGGAVANPINVMAKMIASLTDENHRVTIPGFYDDVLEASAEERADMARAPFNLGKYKEALDINDIMGEEGYSTMERTGIRPCIDCNGIWGGHITEGTKTIIPSKASAKISMRLVPHQDYKKIAGLFEDYFISLAPPGVKVKVTELHGGQAYVSPVESKAYQAASRAFETTFNKKPIPFRSGGSIPIISAFEQILGIKSILIGFGLDSDAIHSPNESFRLDNFYKGIETIPYFYHYFTEALS
jgi:acetylornithine deacetylase/succinyl-diaminopimelate desuccinylase-like protein